MEKEAELELKNKIGEGAYGAVYKGIWLGTEVAVKILKFGFTEDALQNLTNELEIMKKLNHPNLILFMGGRVTNDSYCFITELAEGSLHDFLYKEIKFGNKYTEKQIAKDIATGLNFLHANIIVHRDLKSNNILLVRGTAKICDYGVSKILTTLSPFTTEVGTPNWMAPEIINNQEYDSKVDIYSFGMVMFELCTKTVPWLNMTLPQIVLAVAIKGERPQISSSVPTVWRECINTCWKQTPSERPTSQELMKIIDNLPSFKEENAYPSSPIYDMSKPWLMSKGVISDYNYDKNRKKLEDAIYKLKEQKGMIMDYYSKSKDYEIILSEIEMEIIQLQDFLNSRVDKNEIEEEEKVPVLIRSGKQNI